MDSRSIGCMCNLSKKKKKKKLETSILIFYLFLLIKKKKDILVMLDRCNFTPRESLFYYESMSFIE